jgi:hypothetical protein
MSRARWLGAAVALLLACHSSEHESKQAPASWCVRGEVSCAADANAGEAS